MTTPITTPARASETALAAAIETLTTRLPANLHTKECRDAAGRLRWELGRRLDGKMPEAEAERLMAENAARAESLIDSPSLAAKARKLLTPKKKKGKKKAE